MSADARRLATVTGLTVTICLVLAGCRTAADASDPSPRPANTAAAAPARLGAEAPGQRITFVPNVLELVTSRGEWSASVDPTDTQGDGELALPEDPGRVGWWMSGALAGDAFGSVVVAGHIDSRAYGLGFFARLLDVAPGDRVTLGDGTSSQSYSVASVRRIPKSGLATTNDLFSQHVPGRLVLVTCTGQFDPATHHYEDNLVVLATPLGVATSAAAR